MKKYLLIIIFIVAVSNSFAQQTINKTLIHDGLVREYIIYIPDNYTGNDAVPLLLNFHGLGGSAAGQMVNGDFRPISDTAGFIIVHPQGTLMNGISHWNVGNFTGGSTVDDVGFTDVLIDSVSDEYNIDTLRVYSTGMSNGGFMSFLLACQLSEKITAIASVTGSMTPQTYTWCNPLRPSPIMQIHGTSDFIVPYDGNDSGKPIEEVIEYWVNHNNCNTVPIVTNMPDLDPWDGSTVVHYEYTDGDNGVDVEHFKVIGGGHTWPGSAGGGFGTNYDIDASSEIWNFLLGYELDSNTTDIENLSKNRISIYPNPADSYIIIENVFRYNTDYVIISLAGTVVKNGTINSQSKKVDISQLHSGLYFIKVGKRVFKVNKL